MGLWPLFKKKEKEKEKEKKEKKGKEKEGLLSSDFLLPFISLGGRFN